MPLDLLRLSICAVVFAMAAPVAAATPAGVPTLSPLATDRMGPDQVYRIGARDILNIEIVGEPELSGQFQVAADGVLHLAYIGDIRVAGLGTNETGRVIADAYQPEYLVNPQVTVSVAEFMSMPVQVYGAVKKQGTYYLQKPTTVMEMLNLAGGVDTQNSSRQIVVRHASGEVVLISFDGLRARGEGNLFLKAGDAVTVEDGLFVFVAGHVTKPGAINYLRGLTVTEALTKAGGPSGTALLRAAYVLRDGDKIPVNIKKIQDGKETDLTLQPGDKLYLKESPI